MKYFEKRKLKKYLAHLNDETNCWSVEYLESKKYEIETIEWLIAYYENRAAANPKELLEEYLCPYGKPDTICRNWSGDMKRIYVLYNWIYHKKIVGF